MKKAVALLLILFLFFPFCRGLTASAETSWTVFVYLCGSDLESDSSLGSEDIEEMMDAETGSNVRFVLESGGALEWANGIEASVLERYEICSGDAWLVDSCPAASMADSGTLTDFLNWGLSAYPADRTALILWNHGSGSINGVCFDELYDYESLLLRELDTALKKVPALSIRPLDFIGFDACLMGTLETAAVVSPYARYLVASEETEPGSGWDYAAFGKALTGRPKCSGAEIGELICDSFYNSCNEKGCAGSATLAVVDLGKVPALCTALDAYAEDLYRAADNSAALTSFVRNIRNVDNYGGNNRSEGYTNMIDLGGLIDAGTSWSSHAQEALRALDEAVLYQRKGRDHSRASGLSVYYPLRIQGSEELGIFRDVCVSAYYLGLVDRIAYGFANAGGISEYDNSALVSAKDTILSGSFPASPDTIPDSQWYGETDWESSGESQAISFDVEPFLDEDGTYGFALSEEGLRNTASVQAVLYLLSDDYEDAVCLGYSTDILADWDRGEFCDNFDGYWFALQDGQMLSVNLVEECDGYDLFTAPILLNDEETNLRFVWDYEQDEVYILDLWDGIMDSGASARAGKMPEAGDIIVPIFDSFSLDSDEEYEKYYYGDEYEYEGDGSLLFDLLYDGDYLYGFCIDDIYGDYFLTDFVSFTVDGEDVYFDDSF